MSYLVWKIEINKGGQMLVERCHYGRFMVIVAAVWRGEHEYLR